MKTVAKEKRLSIAYISFGLFAANSNTPYYDIDKIVKETVERGFNAIRLDCGNGLIDFTGKEPNGLIQMCESVPGHDACIRQISALGGNGQCDILERLVMFCQCAKKYGVKLIFSSWYYMHTFWWFDNPERNRFLHEIPKYERFQYFASELNKLLAFLRKKGLLDVVAYSDVFNEFDCPYGIGVKPSDMKTPEQLHLFREDHEKALSFLEKENPDVRFGVNTYTPWTPAELFPHDVKIWDCHNYFMWMALYHGMLNYSTEEEAQKLFKPSPESLEYVYSIPKLYNKYPFEYDAMCWFWFFNNLDHKHIPELEAILAKRLQENKNFFIEKLEKSIAEMLDFHSKYCPNAELYSTEGVTFSPSNDFLFEEHSDLYWEIIEHVVKSYRDNGFTGCVLRTNCGPEDPSWTMRVNDIKRINQIFRS